MLVLLANMLIALRVHEVGCSRLRVDYSSAGTSCAAGDVRTSLSAATHADGQCAGNIAVTTTTSSFDNYDAADQPTLGSGSLGWVTFEPSSASCSGQPHRQGISHWNRTSPPTNTPTSQENTVSNTKE
jgi:hypothetical protein